MADARTTYHHGDLRAALIRAATEIISEVGIANFSIAAAARRTGVSPGAPYRHFPDREALLAAVAVEASEQLAARYRAALATSDDPASQLVAITAAHVQYADEFRAGFDVIYASGLDKDNHPELRESTRALTEILLPINFALAPDAEAAIALGEAYIALVHGYATLLRDGFFRARSGGVDEIAERAAGAVRALIEGFQHPRTRKGSNA
jgi:AcrR family transcriptional regulator